jgi:glucuronoarabinoxylan endo-1,4-beta-xylanase
VTALCRVRAGCVVAALFASACIRRGAAPEGPEEPALRSTVVLAPSERHQALEGFGASIAWYTSQAAGSPSPTLYRTLFPDLGLDILRLRNRYHRTETGDRDLREEVEILRRASQALGHPPKLMLSSWSPPAELKANRAERCRSNKDCTLARSGAEFVYPQFAAYWRESLESYAALGIVPEYVSIQNEPDFIPPDWEGCKFEPSETADYPGYDRALEAVHGALATLPSPPKMLGPEVIGVHNHKVADYVRPMNVNLLYAVAHHLYEKGDDGVWDWRSPGPDSFIEPLKSTAAVVGKKPLFQTEFQTDEDQGIEGGFETAVLIHHTLVEEGATAFLYWDLVWGKMGHGLVSIDGARVSVRDQYYSLRHYARFTDPGDVRIGATTDLADVRTSAFASPDGRRIAVVLLNTGAHPVDVRIDPGGFAAAGSTTYRTTYRPGHSEVWQDLGDTAIRSTVPLPSRSIATVVLLAPG